MNRIEDLRNKIRGSGEIENHYFSGLFSQKEKIIGEGIRVLVFDGHGAQYVGMGEKAYKDYPWVRRIHDHANFLVGFDLTKIMFKGPADLLMQTQYAQPAIVLSSYINTKVLRYEHPELFAPTKSGLSDKDQVTGMSLGFLNATELAGVWGGPDEKSFGTLMRFAKIRGEIFQEVGGLGLTALMAVGYPTKKDKIPAEIIKEMKRIKSVLTAEGFGLELAIDTSDTLLIFGGTFDQLDYVQRTYLQSLREMGFRSKVLEESSAAFHTSWMKKAVGKVGKELDKIPFKDAQVSIISNTSRPVKILGKAKEIKAEHLALVTEPVYTSAISEFLGRQGAAKIYELGDRGPYSNSLASNPKFWAGVAIVAGAGFTVAHVIRTRRKSRK